MTDKREDNDLPNKYLLEVNTVYVRPYIHHCSWGIPVLESKAYFKEIEEMMNKILSN